MKKVIVGFEITMTREVPDEYDTGVEGNNITKDVRNYLKKHPDYTSMEKLFVYEEQLVWYIDKDASSA